MDENYEEVIRKMAYLIETVHVLGYRFNPVWLAVPTVPRNESPLIPQIA